MSKGVEKILQNLTRNQWVGVGIVGLLVATGAYFLIKKIGSDTTSALGKGAKWFGDHTGLTAAGDSIGTFFNAVADSSPDGGTDTLASWYDPTQRSVFFYDLTFPDGQSHFVGGSSVNPDGTFIRSGITYRIGNSKMGDLRAYPWSGSVATDDTNDFGVTNNSGWG